jgi:hypothetical protein
VFYRVQEPGVAACPLLYINSGCPAVILTIPPTAKNVCQRKQTAEDWKRMELSGYRHLDPQLKVAVAKLVLVDKILPF